MTYRYFDSASDRETMIVLSANQLRGEPMSQHRQIELADDKAYYSRRAAEEARRAERAITPQAQRSHRELAAIFDRKASEIPA